MAHAVVKNYLDTATPVGIAAPAGLLLGVSLLAGMPELGILIVLIAYAVLSGKAGGKVQLCPDHSIGAALVGAFRSKPVAIVFGTLLVSIPLGMPAQFYCVLVSGLAYLVLHEVGKQQQTKTRKLIRNNVAKPTGWRRAATESTSNAPTDVPWKRASQNSANAKPRKAPSPASSTSRAPSNVVEGAGGTEAEVLTGLDAEVRDLVRSATPSKSDDAVMRKLLKMARKCILPVVPEADINVIPSGNLDIIGATGSKPEVDMIVTVDKQLLAERLKAFFLKGQSRIQKSLDTLLPDVLQKTATKVLSERLTFVRFWRSQFSGPEPMIVLLVPVELGFFNYPIRLNFSVNTPYPLRLSTVLSKESVRSKELILLVTRWARERCVANTSKGQPHAYAWGLLVVYFLRSGAFAGKTAMDLFKAFIGFYEAKFGSSDTPVSVYFSGTPPEPVSECTASCVPYIEDPFDSAKNAAEFMTADGMARVSEELQRAGELLAREGATLADVLERWTPPAADASPVASPTA